MAASFGGHVDIVRLLIEAKAHINTQAEVCCSTTRNHTTLGKLSLTVIQFELH